MKEIFVEVTYPWHEVEYWLDKEDVVKSEIARLQKIHNGKLKWKIKKKPLTLY